FFFFFQAEDGIRDLTVTGVQTCALPICWRRPSWTRELLVETLVRLTGVRVHVTTMSRALALVEARRGRPRPTVGCPWPKAAKTRSEERRVGKECRARWSA